MQRNNVPIINTREKKWYEKEFDLTKEYKIKLYQIIIIIITSIIIGAKLW